MFYFICLDNHRGLRFNNRRVSHDRVVTADIIQNCSHTLFLDTTSFPLFEGKIENISYSFDIPTSQNMQDSLFIEYLYQVDFSMCTSLTIYHWNRSYPSDEKLAPLPDHFMCIHTEELTGYSHEKITKEIWINEEK